MLGNMALLAAETPNPVTPGAMDAMLNVMDSLLTFSMSVFDTVTGNPIMMFIVAGSLVGVGITVLRQVKSGSRERSHASLFFYHKTEREDYE